MALNDVPLALNDVGAERRCADRHMTVLIVGKVRDENSEFPCVVNNVSRGGLKARFPYPPTVGQELLFSLRGLPDMLATVRWVEGNHGGVEFDRPITLDAILEKYGSSRKPRAPRFTCNRTADFILDSRGGAIDLIDVSLGGAKIGLDRPPTEIVGHAGTLILPILGRPRAGTVRWVGAEQIGFQFAMPLPLDTLAELLSTSTG